jgi:hypothetical protein
MFSLRAVLVVVRDLKVSQDVVGRLMIAPEVTITEHDQPLVVPQFGGPPLQPRRDPIPLEVCDGAKDVARALVPWLFHHERGVPGGGLAEHAGVP